MRRHPNWARLRPAQTYLLVVADPTNLVAPADPNKVASLVLPSIIAMAPQWSTTDGGVNYGYTIGNSELPQATTVDLEWASGLTVNTVIGTPILSTSTGTAQGSYQLHATPAKLGLPPAGARYLLVVVDSGNLVAPANPSKTASTPDTTATTPLAIVLGSAARFGHDFQPGVPQASNSARERGACHFSGSFLGGAAVTESVWLDCLTSSRNDHPTPHGE